MINNGRRPSNDGDQVMEHLKQSMKTRSEILIVYSIQKKNKNPALQVFSESYTNIYLVVNILPLLQNHLGQLFSAGTNAVSRKTRSERKVKDCHNQGTMRSLIIRRGKSIYKCIVFVCACLCIPTLTFWFINDMRQCKAGDCHHNTQLIIIHQVEALKV